MYKIINKEKGFTLIELIFVMGVIGLLTAIAAPQLSKYSAVKYVNPTLLSATQKYPNFKKDYVEKFGEGFWEKRDKKSLALSYIFAIKYNNNETYSNHKFWKESENYLEDYSQYKKETIKKEKHYTKNKTSKNPIRENESTIALAILLSDFFK